MKSRFECMRFSPATWSAVISMASLATVLACGGSGGGGGGSSTSGGGGADGLTEVVIEPRTSDNYVVNPANVRVGDRLSLRLWGRNSAGQITFVTVSDWTTDAPASVARVTPGGSFEAVGTTSTTYRLRALGGAFATNFVVNPATGGTLSGKVRIDDGTGVPNSIVRIFNSSGGLLGTAATGSNGTFRLGAPFSTTSFFVDMTGLSSRFYSQFGYGPKEYSSLCPEIRPATPAISSSGPTFLPSNPVVYQKLDGSTPPPPPPGCGL